MEGIEEPRSEQGRCWVGWQRCEREGSGTGRVCRWSGLARNVTIALLYVGSRAKEVQSWVEEDADFVEEAEGDGQKALERFFKSEVDWSGMESNRLCELSSMLQSFEVPILDQRAGFATGLKQCPRFQSYRPV